jgi:DNA (cytosine-5)-methyltransferase 1
MVILYNEWEPFPAQWLRNLVSEGHLPPGDVLEDDVRALDPARVRGYSICHFFAGIGGWAQAMELADWPVTTPLWTASLPCQPFSAAGLRKGTEDERHLWPAFRDLVAECRPAALAGEQVATPAGRAWCAGVRADLEALGYAVGAVDLCAASVGAPHARQRLFWMAAPQDGGVGHAVRTGLEGHPRHEHRGQEPGRHHAPPAGPAAAPGCAGDGGPWAGVYVPCADGKARRIEPGLEPLVNGFPSRVGRVRAYGNGIVPQLGAVILTLLKERLDDQ